MPGELLPLLRRMVTDDALAMAMSGKPSALRSVGGMRK